MPADEITLKFDLDPEPISALAYYSKCYDFLFGPMILRRGEKFTLGAKKNRICRFCRRGRPDASFKKKAHVIPESLGNKTLFSFYECDECNQFFGNSIENDLGNWSKPHRTFARISGINGVPKLKQSGPDSGWRIEYFANKFHIEQYEEKPVFNIDKDRRRVSFRLHRDVFTPVAVLKAFVKIGLTLLPTKELPNFNEALEWIRCPDHNKGLVREFPIFRTFRPGPQPNDLVSIMLFRRKASVNNVLYAFIVLTYGNEMFQIFLPCPMQDLFVSCNALSIPVFPPPSGSDFAEVAKPRVEKLDLCNREKIKGQKVSVVLGFDELVDSDFQ